jgi:hypothetical protein
MTGSRVAPENEGPETKSTTAEPSDADHSERRIWWTVFAVGAMVFVGIMMLGRPLVEGRLAAARNLDRATALIAGTDDALAALDPEVRAVSATGTTAIEAGTLPAISDLRATLDQAARLSQTGYERLTQEEQKRAEIIKAMAIARIAVLDAADAVLSADGGDAASPAREEALDVYDRAVEKARQTNAALVNL